MFSRKDLGLREEIHLAYQKGNKSKIRLLVFTRRNVQRRVLPSVIMEGHFPQQLFVTAAARTVLPVQSNRYPFKTAFGSDWSFVLDR